MKQDEAAVRRLLPGVWKLESVDGQPGDGWLTFSDSERGFQLSFSMVCGAQNGYYALRGNLVIPDLRTSVGPNCSREEIASSPIRVPELLARPFQVNVSERALIATGPGPTGPLWATYARSSAHELMREAGVNRQRPR